MICIRTKTHINADTFMKGQGSDMVQCTKGAQSKGIMQCIMESMAGFPSPH